MFFILTTSVSIKIHKAKLEASCSYKVCALKFVHENSIRSFIWFIPIDFKSFICDYPTSHKIIIAIGSGEIETWNKKGKGKKIKTSIRRSRVFKIALNNGGNENFSRGILSFNAFAMLTLTCEYIKAEIKKLITGTTVAYKSSLYRVITWKLLFDRKGTTLLTKKHENWVRSL